MANHHNRFEDLYECCADDRGTQTTRRFIVPVDRQLVDEFRRYLDQTERHITRLEGLLRCRSDSNAA